MMRSMTRAPQNPHGKIPIHARWYRVETEALFGRTIGELCIRKLTGTTIIAIVRDGVTAQFPDIDFTLLEGDEVYVVGTRGQLAFFERVFGMSESLRANTKLTTFEKKIA